MIERISFRSLARADLPNLVRWNHAPHVAEWMDNEDPLTIESAEAKYGPRIDGVSPVTMHIVEVNGHPIGYLQHYLVRSYPDYLAAVGDEDAAAIDYVIGEERFTGRGLGPQIIRAYINSVVVIAHPDALRIIATPSNENFRSHRALEKVGFHRGKHLVYEDRPGERLYLVELPLMP